ncbi:nitrilase-related carbon-nitrogen hydrolase [Hydrogenothermus marinus]|uniref:Putative amidohydrolase n=1 Tax=Hydrogenothermus marinus TaxID=133270 RepID=A0A3M0BQY8_9AQUI|nr:nitrilase-related carbon-nitrogen hydrolase [Hydrogenothermus marinus]RMA93342.1 putative amidohydrolase [Hydrogenothermus marinus]
MKIYSLQINLELGNIEKNMEKIFSYIDKIEKSSKTSLLLLPEMFSSGFDNENLENHAKETPQIYKDLEKLSLEKNLVISGTLPEKSRYGIYNKAFVIDKGDIIFKRAKVKLFTPTNEDKYFKPGKNSFDIAESSVGNLGIMICFELRYPNISHILRKKGVEIILIPAQWGLSRKEHLEILSKARAIENQSFVVVSDTTDKIGRISYAGSSAIYDPWGKTLAFIDSEEGLVEADINLSEVYRVRRKIKMEI